MGTGGGSHGHGDRSRCSQEAKGREALSRQVRAFLAAAPFDIGLAAVDRVDGERQTRQLADGWMGRESRSGRRLRTLGVRALLALVTRLAPADLRATPTNRGATPTAAV